jgi:hypothetical protein
MSKLDKVKTYIDLLKSFLLALFLGLLGMGSYLFINAGSMNIIQLAVIVIAIIGDIVVLTYGIRTLFKKINELEEL